MNISSFPFASKKFLAVSSVRLVLSASWTESLSFFSFSTVSFSSVIVSFFAVINDSRVAHVVFVFGRFSLKYLVLFTKTCNFPASKSAPGSFSCSSFLSWMIYLISWIIAISLSNFSMYFGVSPVSFFHGDTAYISSDTISSFVSFLGSSSFFSVTLLCSVSVLISSSNAWYADSYVVSWGSHFSVPSILEKFVSISSLIPSKSSSP